MKTKKHDEEPNHIVGRVLVLALALGLGAVKARIQGNLLNSCIEVEGFGCSLV
ncbi:hypothetical protein BJY04DRAFT_182896, partial [Aspergillus karnatakaensis]|uniref:uncharacterized protein n=1 Tax=Aspergillus karnatakaensis TaxID=1810916 RepID=UPI003CCD3016